MALNSLNFVICTVDDVAGYHEETGAEKSLSVTITVEKALSNDAQYF